MSGRRSETFPSKNRRKKLKKKFLLTSKNYWLIEQTLLPLYQHLVDGYSERLRDEWRVKVEESETFAAILQVKEEPQTDQNGYMLESLQQSSSSMASFTRSLVKDAVSSSNINEVRNNCGTDALQTTSIRADILSYHFSFDWFLTHSF